MLLKIALLPNLTRHFALQVTKDVCAYLDSLGVTYGFEETLRGNLDTHGIFLPTDTLLSEADAVIAIGGDGSLIQAANATRQGASQYPGVEIISSSVALLMVSFFTIPRSSAWRIPVVVLRTRS